MNLIYTKKEENNMNFFSFSIKKNILSGLTLGLVSIPLSLALAISSGATPSQGIITAVWAGCLGALFGGSSFNIIGPTGALSGILISYSLIHGYQYLPIIAILSGLIILICYFLKLDRYIIFIPRSVINGFTIGIAFIIILSQLDNALGLSSTTKSANLLQNSLASLKAFPLFRWDVFLIFFVCLCFIVIWNKTTPRIPSAISITVIGIIFGIFINKYHIINHIPILADNYPQIKTTIFDFSHFSFSWKFLLQIDIWLISFTTAIIAILETLLSGQIADKITHTKFNRSREVLGLAIANIGSGLMGGIPATAALARTTLNIKSGATNKLSGIISSISAGVFCLFFFPLLKFLPLSVIAAILVVVAISMVEKKHFIRLIENERKSLFISITVAIITIFEDPIIGIISGSFLALLIFVNRISHGQSEINFYNNKKLTQSILKNDLSTYKLSPADVVVYNISGTLTYINMPAHLNAVTHIRNNKHIIISLQHSFYADSDGIDYLAEIIDILKETNKEIVIAGINKEIKKLIVKEDFYKNKMINGKIYADISQALDDVL
jgi:sulfate permease, SulP family